MKRLAAMLLLVCTLASFVVPATFADDANVAGTTSASYNYNATAWVVIAPAEGTMSATDVAAAMVDGNKLDTASITYSDKTDSLGKTNYNISSGVGRCPADCKCKTVLQRHE